MSKRIGGALVVVLALLGLYQAASFGVQLRTDYQNFKKIVVWVYQKQAQEEAARQRQQAQRAVPTPAAPAPVAVESTPAAK